MIIRTYVRTAISVYTLRGYNKQTLTNRCLNLGIRHHSSAHFSPNQFLVFLEAAKQQHSQLVEVKADLNSHGAFLGSDIRKATPMRERTYIFLLGGDGCTGVSSPATGRRDQMRRNSWRSNWRRVMWEELVYETHQFHHCFLICCKNRRRNLKFAGGICRVATDSGWYGKSLCIKSTNSTRRRNEEFA